MESKFPESDLVPITRIRNFNLFAKSFSLKEKPYKFITWSFSSGRACKMMFTISKVYKFKEKTSTWNRKGNCWDNAVAESFFSILKREMESNIFYDINDARNEISEYIELFYNRQRIHSFLDYKSPYEYEELAS